MKASTANTAKRSRLRSRNRVTHAGIRTVALVVMLIACGEDAVPPAAASGRGSTPADAGTDASWLMPGQRRPARGPRLPYADEEVVLVAGESTIVLLTVNAGLGALDVQLSIDTTQSMVGEIDALQRDLQDRVVVGLVERVADVAFGVSRFEDFPAAPFGSPAEEARQRADTPFALLTAVTTDLERVASAVAALDQPLGLGGDNPESGAEALWQIATGGGYRTASRTLVDPFVPERSSDAPGVIGGAGFREGAMHVVLHVTDAPSHTPTDYGGRFPGTHTLAEAATALAAIDAKLVGIVARPCPGDECALETDARAALELVAHETGAAVVPDADGRCPHGVRGESIASYEGGCPLVFDVADDGSGLSDALVDGIAALVEGIRFDVIHGTAADDPLGFVARIVPVQVEQTSDADPPEIADVFPEDAPDGDPDAFVDVRAKTELGFEVYLANRNVTPTDIAQSFRVVVRIVGDGLVVQERTLRLVVPAAAGGADDPGIAEADAG